MNTTNLNFHSKVHYQDGQAGRLVRVAIDPDQLEVTNLIVEYGLLLKHARVFPITSVVSTDDKNIYLSINREDLGGYPIYFEKEYERPAREWEHPHYQIDSILFPGQGLNYPPPPKVKKKVHYGISSRLMLIKEGNPIKNSDGTIGKLDHVVTDSATNELAYLVIEQGLFCSRQVTIPVNFVVHMSEDGIFMDLTRQKLDQIARLPTVR